MCRDLAGWDKGGRRQPEAVGMQRSTCAGEELVRAGRTYQRPWESAWVLCHPWEPRVLRLHLYLDFAAFLMRVGGTSGRRRSAGHSSSSSQGRLAVNCVSRCCQLSFDGGNCWLLLGEACKNVCERATSNERLSISLLVRSGTAVRLSPCQSLTCTRHQHHQMSFWREIVLFFHLWILLFWGCGWARALQRFWISSCA